MTSKNMSKYIFRTLFPSPLKRTGSCSKFNIVRKSRYIHCATFHLKDKHITLFCPRQQITCLFVIPPTKKLTSKYSIYKAVYMMQSCENIHRIFKQELTITVCNVIIHIHGKIFFTTKT